LAGLKDLQYLNLYSTEVTGAIFDTLKNLTSLRKLYVWQTNIDPAEARRYEQSVNLEINTGIDLELAAAEARSRRAEEEAVAAEEAKRTAQAEKKAAEEAAAKKAAEEAARKKAEDEAAAAEKAKTAPAEPLPPPPIEANPQ
jgi:hypothetical protein